MSPTLLAASGQVARRTALKALACVALSVLFLLGAAPALAQGSAAAGALEHRVKAASLLRFLGYVDWPSSVATDAYRIGVIGADGVAAELESLVRERPVNGRTVAVRRLHPDDPLDDLDELFVGLVDSGRVAAIVRRAQGQSILVVTAIEGGLAAGAMINFRIADERVRFEVALDAVEQAGLRISSRMLSVALQVVRAQAR